MKIIPNIVDIDSCLYVYVISEILYVVEKLCIQYIKNCSLALNYSETI